MGGVLLRALVGLGAGVTGWFAIELFTKPAGYGLGESSTADAAFEMRMIALVGLLVGLTLGGLSGWSRGSRRYVITGVCLGGLFGLVGALSGAALAAQIAGPLTMLRQGPLEFLWRTAVIAPLGFGIGAGIGGASLNTRRFVQGAIGGLLGGAVAGVAFNFVAAAFAGPQMFFATGPGGVTEIGGPARAITFALIGAMVGLFIGLVERIARTAWVRLVLGKNEGREFSLDSATTHLGRDERAGIPLWGDPNVAPLHATISRQGPHWLLQDHGSPLGTAINGQRIGQAGLVSGTVFQIGRHTLEFLTKGGPRAAAVPMASNGPVNTPLQPLTHTQGVPIQGVPIQGVPMQGVPMQGVPMQGVPIQGVSPPASGSPFSVPSPMATVVVPAAKEAVVVAMDGPVAGARIVFADDAEIGREGGALPLSFDNGVSRRHAKLSISPGGLLLEDVGSTNGTFVNGAKITRTFLKAGDVFKIGMTTFRVEKAE